MIKFSASAMAVRPAAAVTAIAPPLRQLGLPRHYATQNSLGTTAAASGPKRKTVTPFNDDGQVPWNALSSGEKAARATQQSFNFGLILLGLVMTVS